FRRQPPGLSQLASKIRVARQDRKAALFRSGSEDARERAVHARRAVMGWPKFQSVGSFGNPGAMFEDSAKFGNKGLQVHCGGSHGPRRRMQSRPVVGDLFPSGEPDTVMLAEMVQRALQSQGTARTARQPTMQADRQHLRRACLTFRIEHVEAVLEIALELLAVGKARLD